MNRMDNHNYWNDSRVREGMIDRGKVVEEDGREFLVVESDEEEGDIKLVVKWGNCETCDGKGTHTNPSIDAGGICEGDEFWEDDADDEGRSAYASGMYDVTCVECKGSTKTPQIDEKANDAKMIKRYDDYMDDEYAYAAESAAERAMGA